MTEKKRRNDPQSNFLLADGGIQTSLHSPSEPPSRPTMLMIFMTKWWVMSQLHEAASLDDADSIKSGIRQGLDLNERDSEWGGRTPLHVACSLGHADCVEVLLDKGANVDIKREVDGWTPLHCSCERGEIECVKLLLDSGASSEIQDKYGDTPQRIAEIYGHLHIVSVLKSHTKPSNCLCDNSSAYKSGHVSGVDGGRVSKTRSKKQAKSHP